MRSCFGDIGRGHHQGIVRKIVEESRRPVEKEWQVILDAAGKAPIADFLVDEADIRVMLDGRAVILAKRLDGCLVGRKFPAGQHADALDLLDCTLCLGVESPDRVDLVVEEIDAVGQVASHRVEIKQRAAYRELAMLQHLRDIAVTCLFERRTHLLEVERFAFTDQQAVSVNERRRT